jgi:hypothetical protein
MAQIAITQPRGNVLRMFAATLILAVGLVLGFGVAQLLPAAGFNQAAAAVDQAATLAADKSYQAQRAGERAGTVSLSGDPAYQAQRAGERSTGSGPVDLSTDSGWQAQRAGERGSTP